MPWSLRIAVSVVKTQAKRRFHHSEIVSNYSMGLSDDVAEVALGCMAPAEDSGIVMTGGVAIGAGAETGERPGVGLSETDRIRHAESSCVI